MVFLGEGCLANELLSNTKGQGMGFGWTAFGFGFAFFVSLAIWNGVSAHMNPAFVLGLWLIGEVDAADFFALSAAELGGAMVGALLVWIHYLPHFKTLPEPPGHGTHDSLLRSRDSLPRDALNISSYDTRPHAAASKGIADALKDIRYYLLQPAKVHEPYHASLIEHALGHDAFTGPEGFLRRRSVQVCDMHDRLKAYDLGGGETTAAAAHIPHLTRSASAVSPDSTSITLDMQNGAATSKTDVEKVSAQDDQRLRLDALYRAVVIADQNAKLSVFATRPGIRSPFFNWIVEFLAMAVLFVGAKLIDGRGAALTGELAALWGPMKAFYVGLFIVVLLLGTAGPTGNAINPARDFGPRLMHWVLPIAGKGPSEWGYAWVPVTANFVGGLVGGALYKKINEIYIVAPVH
ncbi:aquaporin-like protein [Coccomyxa subellipsoidea C-169]|uniref:Aquaporin-like protein n=1 Tax=Coccomyxa subellipsoidea (strain C-169) TaxID=574566 RepID=I0YNK8_COCSC|nr:aquaporin-like protein [Coccomyxa subellipsoidea C-169]EIE19977.1 aquaporin-like protein [Coccomyxa subellipsoidea C-169]|eukprot:XP_005644521.1 aquaporin-like protein [Coccomyxa subellipsoidea C-169]